MPKPTATQLFVYAALAVVLLLIGARAIRSEGGGAEVATASASGGGEAGGAGGDEGTGGIEISGAGGDVVVDVAGAVADPGVYRLPAGSRVIDALRRAGGTTGAALPGTINRAARLADGQQVVVPAEAAGGEGSAASADAPAAEDQPISLGTATVEQLETIEGIGPVTAGKIVEYRDGKGGLSSVEQLDEVSGIGPATLGTLRERLQP